MPSSLVLIGRYNLNAEPYRPIMTEPDTLYYRKTLAEIRKVTWGVSDLVFTTLLLGATPGDVISSGGNMIHQNGALVTTGYAPRCANIINFVDILTLAESSSTNSANFLAPNGVAHGPGGFIAQLASIAAVAGAGASGDTNPPGALSEASVGTGATFSHSPFNYDPVIIGNSAYWMIMADSTTTVDPGVEYLKGYLMRMNVTTGAVTVSQVDRAVYRWSDHLLGGEVFSFGSGSINKPIIMRTDSAGNVYAITNGAANRQYFNRFSPSDFATGALFNNQTDFLLPQGDYISYTLGTAGHSGFHIDKNFNKLYCGVCTAAGNMNRLFNKPLSGLTTIVGGGAGEYYDVDGGGSVITGIWTFPPLLYVAKTSGAGFGPQLLKFYDTDLVNRRRKRRGGELWGIVPEVANYLG